MPATIVLFGDIFDSFGVLLGGGGDCPNSAGVDGSGEASVDSINSSTINISSGSGDCGAGMM